MRGNAVIAIGGENLIDTVQTALPSGEITQKHNLGGSPYNVAVALARQTMTPYYLTPISTDGFGEQLADHLRHEGVVLAGKRRPEPTTQAIVTLENGIPYYVFRRDDTAERAVSVADINAAMPKSVTHFHAGSLAFAGGDDANAWEEAFHKAHKSGLSTSLDPNVRTSLVDDIPAYRARFARLLRSATIVKLSDEDLAAIYPDLSQSDGIEELRRSTSARLVILTKGPEGAVCWTLSQRVTVANPDVPNLIDTIGAGDTFTATVLASLVTAGLLNDSALAQLVTDQLRALLDRAVQAACLNCTKEGCNPPTSAAIDAVMQKGMT
jgi:fructokinase